MWCSATGIDIHKPDPSVRRGELLVFRASRLGFNNVPSPAKQAVSGTAPKIDVVEGRNNYGLGKITSIHKKEQGMMCRNFLFRAIAVLIGHVIPQ